MSDFTADELTYLQEQTMCRLATVGPDGRPHVVPMTYRFNVDEDAIDIGGIAFGSSKKWRDVQADRRVTVLVDTAQRGSAQAVEIRGDAEVHETGGETINPRFPDFRPEYIRVRPRRIVSWGLDGTEFQPYGRSVG